MSATATSEPLRALVIGCGAVAGGYDAARGLSPDGEVLSHARAYGLHPGFRLVACIEPDAARRAEFMAAWGIPHGFASLAECDVPFDVASVCVPTEAHVETLERLLAAPPPQPSPARGEGAFFSSPSPLAGEGWGGGAARTLRAVWCEKPLSLDLAAATRLVEAYRAAGVLLAVNYMRRWDPDMVALRDDIASGRLGRLQSAFGRYTKGIATNGSHMLDLLAFLTGAPLAPLAVHRRLDDFSADDPTLTATLATADGAPVQLAGLDRAAFTVFELDLAFERARVTIEESGYRMRRQAVVDNPRYPGYRMLEAAESRPTGLGRAFLSAADNIHRAVTAGAPLASDGASALAVQSLCAGLTGMAAHLPWGETR
ncbi:Gfo/Idh/MocA family protein [Magnetospirillum sp. UT-4]|uniref:Gfo/Idh/MocA family protein n=1 Tax=Magnetospirillum sp. UT-4 TaxID=2681467 RepID=UPI00137D7F8C|nr:Gfo/Idh/MocA family oxidoreductase [Magnetospirillum sp. UT-4]CAA7618672.1 Predicted dehydrogenase and related protein [Magnetospirillum sp. UT-4]